ncbi:hypothetical protein MIDIC_110089 [Alphaproteobacteria bacterium]
MGHILIPTLKTENTIILDNVHQSTKVKELLTNLGHEIIFLPPHSPGLNRIDHYWF